MTRDQFVDDMAASFAAMLARMGKRERMDARTLAAAVFDRMQLCGWILDRKPPAPLHGTPPFRPAPAP